MKSALSYVQKPGKGILHDSLYLTKFDQFKRFFFPSSCCYGKSWKKLRRNFMKQRNLHIKNEDPWKCNWNLK